MRDEFSAERLPDLPVEGYSSRRQKEATDAIMHFMRGCERNRPLLLYIVCLGKHKWRQMARGQWRGLRIDTSTLDAIFYYFLLQAGPAPEKQLEVLANMKRH